MIKVKKITCRNFLSYGNAPTEFILDKHKATLIRGRNGRGKSVLLDLLIYGLYGKPYRNINKPQLISSINKNELLVEIEFSVNGSDYTVRRGMRPAVFDIMKNGVLVDQEAATKDYQGFLEAQILKVGEKTFKQIAVLGSASYVPFMQLPAHQRRDLIESILDIEVFSRMNAILKDRVASTKEEHKSITHKVDLKKSEATAQQKLIGVMKEHTKQRVTEYENQRDALLLELSVHSAKVDALNGQCARSEEETPVFDELKYDTTTLTMSSLNKEVTSLEKKLKTVHSLDECPTCMQKVSEEHVGSVHAALKTRIAALKTDLNLFNEDYTKLVAQRDALYDHQEAFGCITKKLIEEQREMASVQKQISSVSATIVSILTKTDDAESEQQKLRDIASEAIKLIERKTVLTEEKHLQEVAQHLLKDTGIKTAIVREYLPILNQLINKYLAMFDFFVDFTLNESFEEVIKSRGRDVYSYSSFSEGEKRKIDFSILMAFRQLAALKNSAKTNVLIFDEILDSNLDLDAREQADSIISQIPDSNVIVISHTAAKSDNFDRVLLVEKQGDFSVITESF